MTLRIEVFADDVDASAAFYRRVLGFEEISRQHDGDRTRYVSVGRGAARIGIGTGGRPPGAGVGAARLPPARPGRLLPPGHVAELTIPHR
jgi:catechol 2,3-dioxygenase-like lactoylglutathione lyase family enzyme